jgi:bifunctional non-homologous end joining protein LigD
LVLRQACKLGAEGIVSKRVDRRYAQGRTENWLKCKCLRSREFIVGGFTDPTASRRGFGAILVGCFDERNQLRYAGRVGTGFTDQTLLDLRRRFDGLGSSHSPFVDFGRDEAERDVHWLRPELVVDVEFGGWTDDGLVRFGSYRGLRDDLAADEIEKAPLATTVDQPQHRRGPIARQLTLPAELSQLRLTHADRMVYPELGVTKLGVATYYAQVASWMLPHIAGRPMSLLRCPKGCQEPCFFQKRAPTGLHESVERVQLPSSEGDKIYLVIHDLLGLLSLVQFSVLEFHIWGARHDLPLRPDRIVFDLDPDEAVAWPQVTGAARRLREVLESLGLTSFVKTTGGKGLHVVVPLRRRHEWSEVKQFSAQVAATLVAQSPGRFTSNPSKAARRGKIYIDFLRNTRGATAIAPYSTRARPTAPVSLPISWDELDVLPGADAYNLHNVVRRLENLTEDPWAGICQIQQSLNKTALKKLQSRA